MGVVLVIWLCPVGLFHHQGDDLCGHSWVIQLSEQRLRLLSSSPTISCYSSCSEIKYQGYVYLHVCVHAYSFSKLNL